MSTLTIRIEDELKKKAAKQAKKMGISVSFVVKNALKNFVETATFTIGEIEEIEMPPHIQKKAEKIGKLLDKIEKNKVGINMSPCNKVFLKEVRKNLDMAFTDIKNGDFETHDI